MVTLSETWVENNKQLREYVTITGYSFIYQNRDERRRAIYKECPHKFGLFWAPFPLVHAYPFSVDSPSPLSVQTQIIEILETFDLQQSPSHILAHTHRETHTGHTPHTHTHTTHIYMNEKPVCVCVTQ